MDEKKLRKMARSGKYIPGIYNYCDRWCERCPLASRCMNRAMELEDADSDGADRDINNARFWKKISDNFATVLRMIERDCKKRGIVFTTEDLEEAGKLQRKRDAKVRQSSLTKAANAYGMASHKWFDSHPKLIKEKAQTLTSIADMELPGHDPVADAREIAEAIEIISWYQFFIGAKTTRAVGSLRDLLEEAEEIDPAQRDSNGSAKIALIAIDRSLAAWARLREHFPDEADKILDFLVDLDRLRRAMEKTFPDARDFKRPGFDDPKVMGKIGK